MLFDHDDRVDELAHRYALIESPPAPAAELRVHLLGVRVANPAAEMIEYLKDTPFEILWIDGTESGRPFICDEVSRDIARQAWCVDFDELNEFRGDHLVPRMMSNAGTCTRPGCRFGGDDISSSHCRPTFTSYASNVVNAQATTRGAQRLACVGILRRPRDFAHFFGKGHARPTSGL
jgi:hypothetical protein